MSYQIRSERTHYCCAIYRGISVKGTTCSSSLVTKHRGRSDSQIRQIVTVPLVITRTESNSTSGDQRYCIRFDCAGFFSSQHALSGRHATQLVSLERRRKRRPGWSASCPSYPSTRNAILTLLTASLDPASILIAGFSSEASFLTSFPRFVVTLASPSVTTSFTVPLGAPPPQFHLSGDGNAVSVTEAAS